MKTLKSILHATLIIIALSATAFALPEGKGGPTFPALKKESDFQALKGGDKVVLVCKASNSVTVIDIKDQKAALELCREGRMVNCPLCKKKFKITRGNPAGKGTSDRTEILIVNEKGEPCMFFAKLL